jgi:hypothetical protein
MYQLQFGK